MNFVDILCFALFVALAVKNRCFALSVIVSKKKSLFLYKSTCCYAIIGIESNKINTGF